MDFEIFLVQNLEIFTNNTAHSNVCLETQKARVVPVQAVNMDPPTLNSQLNPSARPGVETGGTTSSSSAPVECHLVAG